MPYGVKQVSLGHVFAGLNPIYDWGARANQRGIQFLRRSVGRGHTRASDEDVVSS